MPPPPGEERLHPRRVGRVRFLTIVPGRGRRHQGFREPGPIATDGLGNGGGGGILSDDASQQNVSPLSGRSVLPDKTIGLTSQWPFSSIRVMTGRSARGS